MCQSALTVKAHAELQILLSHQPGMVYPREY